MTELLAQITEVSDGVVRVAEGRSDTTLILILVLVAIVGCVGAYFWKIGIPDQQVRRDESNQRQKTHEQQVEISRTISQTCVAIGGQLHELHGDGEVCVTNTDTLVAIERARLRALVKINERFEGILTAEIGEIRAILEQNSTSLQRGQSIPDA